MANVSYEDQLVNQAKVRKDTVELIKTVSDLWYDKSIELLIFRNQLIDKNVSEIINLHEYAGEFIGKPIAIEDTLAIANAINAIDLPPSRIDLGKLTYEYKNSGSENAEDFVRESLKDAKDIENIEPRDVVLYGFGRIGRLLARELMSKVGKGQQLRLRAIVTRDKNDPTLIEKKSVSITL